MSEEEVAVLATVAIGEALPIRVVSAAVSADCWFSKRYISMLSTSFVDEGAVHDKFTVAIVLRCLFVKLYSTCCIFSDSEQLGVFNFTVLCLYF